MIISVWRYSHLVLAISSCLFLAVASITGIVLAFEPIIEKSNNYKVNGFDTIHLHQAVPLLKAKFPGIQEIAVDDNDFVLVNYSSEEEGDQQVYVNPITGEVLGKKVEKHPVFLWMTTLHRSLFLHETGRIIMGITSFLLILIACSGIFLIVQRQKGWKNFFSNIEKTSFVQYYHAVFGRLFLLFILALAITGTYLAVYRFVPPPEKASTKINEANIKEDPERALKDFSVFQQTTLTQLKKLQFPFSDFPEDYYFLELKHREVCINQFTGDVLAEQLYTTTYQLANFTLRWHTGRSGIVWAILMAVTSAYILFFLYSGFAITLKRRRNRSKNKFSATDARIVILVGSENGSTFRFADAIYSQLIKHGEKVFLTDMSRYTYFPNAEHLVVMTGTYGQGDAPSNAKRFAEKINKYQQQQTIKFSIVGFGQRSYAQFCKFAYDAEQILKQQNWAEEMLPVFTVNDKSPQDFSAWLTEWTKQTGMSVLLPRELLEPNAKDLENLTVSGRTEPDEEGAFIIRFQSKKANRAVSGDLLAIYPKNDHRERLYSIGKVNGQIQLSVKLHEHGLGSGHLNALQKGEPMNAKFVKNKHFRFPKNASQIILVCNGTGIAPFLGMIDENKKKIPIQLYCGFRKKSSFALYQPFLNEQKEKKKLQTIYLSLSREDEMEYVSARLEKNSDAIREALNKGAIMMICGSLSMQDDVLNLLEKICNTEQSQPLSVFLKENKVLTDCY